MTATALATNWCRACGFAPAAPADSCPTCEWPLVEPDLGHPAIGLCVKAAGGLRPKWGIVTGVEGGQAHVKTKADEVVVVDVAAVATLDRRSFSGDDLPSAPGRLMAAHLAARDGDLKAKWEPASALDAAWALGTGSVAMRRAAVADWLELGLAEHADSAGLSPSEVAWLRALAASRKGDTARLLGQLPLLPGASYPGKVELIVRHVGSLAADPAQSEAAVAALAPLAEADPVAGALVVVLRGGTMVERIDAMKVLAGRLAGRDAELGARASALAEAAGRGVIIDPGDLPLPMARAVALWARGRQGDDLDAMADHLLPLPLPMVDDLVDAGALTAASLRSMLLEGPNGPYLQARLAPGALTIEDTYHLGFLAEYARRLYVLGDIERLTQFPPGDPFGDHYGTLLRLRNNPAVHLREGLRPQAIAKLEAVDAYLEALDDGGPALPPAEILVDTTLWRLLRGAALKGRIALSDEDRRAQPAFAAWRDLVEMQRLCFAGEWNQVEAIGLRLKDELTEEALRDEALNMAAYAQAVLGRSADALDLIGDALNGSYTDALVINASIVASELGSEVAAAFLARIYDEAPDRSLGAQALLKGVQLWLADESAETLPEPIIESVRRALQEPQSDEALRMFLTVSSGQDAAWLAHAPVVSVTPEQTDMVNVWRTWAGANSNGPVTITDYANVIITLNKQETVPPWADAQLKKLISLLLDAVSVDFGEAAWVAGAVRVLADSRLLNLVQETILMCQAGAHVAVSLQRDGGEIAEQAERDFLFAPAERWHTEKSDLPDELVKIVDDDVGRCLGIGALSFVIVTDRHMDDFGSQWDALVARERWDAQNRFAILRMEDDLLTGIEAYVERCRRHLQRLNRFPLPEKTEEVRKSMVSDVDNWSRNLARLRSTL